MYRVSTSALRAAIADDAANDRREPLPRTGRIVRRLRQAGYPRAIQWHIDRGLFSPCAY
jgi:hypothetical protein